MSTTVPLSPTIIAFGGVDMPVTLADGSTETVKVRIVKVAEYARFIEKSGSVEKLADFVCAKPDGWSLTIDFNSMMDIVEKAMDLNFTQALRWANHIARAGEAIGPAAAKLGLMLEKR